MKTVSILNIASLAPLLATILVSCMNPGQHTPNGNAPVISNGTGDGAGGNTYLGRPLEDYVVDIRKTEAFKHYLKPALNSLDFGSDFYLIVFYSILHKNWYLIPGDLQTLPSNKIASAVPVEQGAIQTFDAVWIDSKIFNAMPARDQADLILHEMLVGVRLLQFESPKAQCLSFAPNIDYCDGLSTKRSGQPTDLNGKDYEEIRRSVVALYQLPSSAKREDWEDFLAKFHYGFGTKIFHQKDDQSRPISIDEIKQALQSAVASGFLPTYGFLPGEPAREDRCSVRFNFEPQGQSLDLVISRTGEPISQAFPLVGGFTLNTEPLGDRVLKSVQLSSYLFGDEQAKLGSHGFDVTFYFNISLTELAAVELREMVCTKEMRWNSKTTCGAWSSPHDGLVYVCSDQNSSPFR